MRLCTHTCEIDEAPLGKIPRPIEAIHEEIAGNLKARMTNKVSGWQDATTAAGEKRTKLRDDGVFTHDPDRQKLGGTRKEQRFNHIGELLGEHLIKCCHKAGLQEVFANFAARMQTVSDKFKAGAHHGLGEASRAARHKAFEEAEAECFRNEAYADEIADQQELLEMQNTQDYNDVICTAAGGVNMRLYYMCARNDATSWTGATCGIYMPGKFGAAEAHPRKRATGGTASQTQPNGANSSQSS